MRRCGCEDGGDCTKTTVCAIEYALQDSSDMKDEVVEAAENYVGAWADFDHGANNKHVIGRTRDELIHAVNEYKLWEQNA